MKKLTVDGITFETTKEAKAAERELEAIEKIRGRMDVTNPIYAKVLYEKLIEKEMLHTKVGDKFLAELQSYFDSEAADGGAAQEEVAETSQESAEDSVPEEEETVIPYLDGAAQSEPDPEDETVKEYPRGTVAVAEEDNLQVQGAETVEEAFDEMPYEESEKNFAGQGGVSSDTGRLEAILNGALLGEKDLMPLTEDTGDAEEQQPEEEEKIGAKELDALVDEYSETAAGVANVEAATEPPLGLKMEEKAEGIGQEEGEFRLELDDADLYDDDPDDDTLLAEARTLKKELHQEDLSEVFAEHEEASEKKHFSLYGVLIVSLILNVVLIASMAMMVQVFKNSDNRNILNYERILEQEYQTATPSDAE